MRIDGGGISNVVRCSFYYIFFFFLFFYMAGHIMHAWKLYIHWNRLRFIGLSVKFKFVLRFYSASLNRRNFLITKNRHRHKIVTKNIHSFSSLSPSLSFFSSSRRRCCPLNHVFFSSSFRYSPTFLRNNQHYFMWFNFSFPRFSST